jgi:hypothetical protein
MIKLLTIDSEYESAERLGFETNTYLHGRTEDYEKDIIIRWGNSGLYCDRNGDCREFKNVINLSESIGKNCEKNFALKTLSKVVKTPQIFEKIIPDGRLAVHRPTSHSGGKGFKVVTGPFNVYHDFYATEWIKADYEIRVFFCGSKTMAAKRVTQNLKRLAEVYPCRSLWPYDFKIKISRNLHRLVMKAKKALKLDVGAFDILVKDGEYYFLEANTAVTCDSRRITEFYQYGLNCLINRFYSKYA